MNNQQYFTAQEQKVKNEWLSADSSKMIYLKHNLMRNLYSADGNPQMKADILTSEVSKLIVADPQRVQEIINQCSKKKYLEPLPKRKLVKITVDGLQNSRRFAAGIANEILMGRQNQYHEFGGKQKAKKAAKLSAQVASKAPAPPGASTTKTTTATPTVKTNLTKPLFSPASKSSPVKTPISTPSTSPSTQKEDVYGGEPEKKKFNLNKILGGASDVMKGMKDVFGGGDKTSNPEASNQAKEQAEKAINEKSDSLGGEGTPIVKYVLIGLGITAVAGFAWWYIKK